MSRHHRVVPPILGMLNGYGNQGMQKGIGGLEVGELVTNYHDLLDLLPRTSTNAICEPVGSWRSTAMSDNVHGAPSSTPRRPLTHNVLFNFVAKEFDLTARFGIPWGTRIGVVLPNGPELAVTIISVVSRWCAAPINPSNSSAEIRAELESAKAQVIIVQAGIPNESSLYAAGALSLGVIEITPSEDVCGLFSLSKIKSTTIRPNFNSIPQSVEGFVRYYHPETVLLLHTSGTSGNKKLVPYSLDMLVIGVGCIISSWNLGPTDVCLNMMPLFHIGGIVRNIFSPILSGGAVVACSAFDPVLFWDVLSSQRITSYYAAPTMHHAILMEAERRHKPLPVAAIRFIANAAGGLLPALADKLKQTFFNAVILTSYGMTECMPISSPPQSYKMDPVGTSGTKVGPQICISDDHQTSLPADRKGNIFLRGPPCFGGYENNSSATEESFFTIDGVPGWFNTGDVGHLDEQGYLFISGRSKEIINRGGETISPLEIEEALIQHPLVQEALAFSAPHNEYQETVGAVIVSKAGQPRVDLLSLHRFLDDRLHRSKWPQVIVYMPALPKNAAGKILRIKLGERLRLKLVDEDSPLTDRLWEVLKPVPVGASLTSNIDCSQVFPNPAITTELIKSQLGIKDVIILSVDLPSHRGCFVACVTPSSIDKDALMQICTANLHRYLVPAFICALDRLPQIGSGGSTTSSSISISSSNNNNTRNPNATYNPVSVSAIQPEDTKEKSIIFSMHLSRKYEYIRVDEASLLSQVMSSYSCAHVIKPRDDLERAIEGIWRQHLLVTNAGVSGAEGSVVNISIMDNFFTLGGDSLKAGQLVNAMRKQLSVQGLTVPDLFSAPTISAMAKKIAGLGYSLPSEGGGRVSGTGMPTASASVAPSLSKGASGGQSDDNLSGKSPDTHFSLPEKSASNTSYSSLFIQALPLVTVYPIRKMAVWFFVAQPWVMLMDVGVGRLRALVIAMIISRVLTGFLFPLLGISLKWIIVGRYTPGKYVMWGNTYLRWWLVEQVLRILGKGYFSGNLPLCGNYLLVAYYRMLGATIGRNVKLSKGAELGQPDLISIGDNTVVDDAVVRPFTLEERHFVLLPIRIGRDCSVGVRSVVAAGSTIGDNIHIGPQSSSHEVADAHIANRKYCRPQFPQPTLFLMAFMGFPILVLVTVISYLPWYFVLRSMEDKARTDGWYKEDIRTLYDAFVWWCKPQRLPYYFCLRILRKVVVPPIQLILAIIIKNVVIGKFESCERAELESPWNCFKYWLMRSLMGGGGDLCGVAPLVGKHYEIISFIYRRLGSKVGRRVYWPGSGFEVVDYDLLEIGDDVVFGSRSVIMTRSSERAAKVVIGDGAMLADRCVVLPGATLARGSVLGTGGLARENFHYPMGSVWVGSARGNAVSVLPEDQSLKSRAPVGSPFGRAFYDRTASFFVIPLWLIVLYRTIWHVFCCVYHNMPPVLAIYLATNIGHVNRERWIAEVLKIVFVYSVPTYLAFGFNSLLIDVLSKWLLLGRRKPGVYPWDKSSYCQRWQMYLTIQDIRRGDAGDTGMLELLQGSQYIVWYFRALGCSIGDEVCLYPNGANPMMTEPELVTLGNNAQVDDASLIGHINTKGVFSLSEISVGENCVLKTGSRLMSGASMGRSSMLLEHTLILSGDAVDAHTVWQGWPSKVEQRLTEYQRKLRSRLARLEHLDASESCLAAMCSPRRCCCCSFAVQAVQAPLRIKAATSEVSYILTSDIDDNRSGEGEDVERGEHPTEATRLIVRH